MMHQLKKISTHFLSVVHIPYAQRLHQDGPDNNAYYHELFLRGKLSLVGAMSRLVSPGKRLPW